MKRKERTEENEEWGYLLPWKYHSLLVWFLEGSRQTHLLSRVSVESWIALNTHWSFLRLAVCASTGLINAEEALQSTTLEATTIKHADGFFLTRLLRRQYF